MSRKNMTLGLLAAGAFFAAGPAARAGTLLVTITGADAESWYQSTDPTPLGYDVGLYTYIAVTDGVMTEFEGAPAYATFDVMNFYTTFEAGGTQDGNFLVNTYGAQLYTGTEDAPIFAPQGPIAMLATDGVSADYITFTAVPEPAAWAMLLAGFGGVGGMLRAARRRGASAVA